MMKKKKGTPTPARSLAQGLLQASQQPRAMGLEDLIDKAIRDGRIDKRDAGLAQEIAYGVCRKRLHLEDILSRFLKKPLPLSGAQAKEALLAAIYQLLFLERVPAPAVIDDTVELVRSFGEEKFVGMTNGVLRNVLRQGKETLLAEPVSWQVRHSVPGWLAKVGTKVYGEKAEAFFAACAEAAPLHLRLRNGATREELEQDLAAAGCDVYTLEEGLFPESLRLSGRGINLPSLNSFQQGRITVEDEGGQFVGNLAAVGSPRRILDMCASPGGKSAHVADALGGTWDRFLATDLSEDKLERMRSTFERLALDRIDTGLSDALSSEADGSFDLVLVDAPCSGLGTMRRHPEVRWRRDTDTLVRLGEKQKDLLQKAARLVAPGGVLLYSVCTFSDWETTKVAEAFAHGHEDFVATPAEEFQRFQVAPAQYRTAPHEHGTDAFFAARWTRQRS